MGVLELPHRLTLSEAATALGLCERTVQRRIEDGSLRGGKIGGRWYTLAEWLREYIEGGGDWDGPENEQPRGSTPTPQEPPAPSSTSTGTTPSLEGFDARALAAGMKKPPARRSRNTS